MAASNAGLHPVAKDDTAALSFSATNEVRVFVSNASDATKELLKVAWLDDAGRALPNAQEIYLPPGQSRVVRLPFSTNAPATERVRLSGDDEGFDNTIHLVAEQPEQLRVTVLGADDERQPGSLTYFLRRVFQSTVRQQIDFAAFTNAALATLAAKPDFVVVTGADDVGPLLRQQLAAGRTALLVLNREASAGALPQVIGAGNLTVSEGQARQYALLGRIEFAHPLFAPFLDMRFNDFSRIHFWKYRKLDPAAIPNAKILAAFDSGDPALLEIKVDAGTLFVLTSSWLQVDSQLALSSKFVPLLYSMLELNRPAQPTSQNHLVGDPIVLAAGSAATLTPPDGSPINLAADQAEHTFDRPGIHRLKYADGRALAIAVNLDPAESRTGPLKDEELIRIGVPLHTGQQTMNRALAARLEQQKDAETENQQKNWRWLLALGVAVFLFESWLAGRAARASADAPA